MSGLAHAGLGGLVIAFFGGIFSFFSPCVAPLVPGYISYLSSAALRAEREGLAPSAEAGPSEPALPLLLSSTGQRGGALPSKPSGVVLALPRGATTLHMRRAAMVARVSAESVVESVVGSGSAARGLGMPARAPRRLRPTSRRLSAPTVVTLLFVAGFSVAFVALGMLAGTFGQVLAAYRPVMQTLAGIVMVAMGAFLLGLLPQSWTDGLLHEGRLHPAAGAIRGWGMAAPLLLGMVFAAGWTPCIGPVLAGILVAAGASGSTTSGVVLLACYSLGFAVPFLAVGLGWSSGLRMLGWIKRHSGMIATVSGIALIAIGLLYLTGEVAIFSNWAARFTLP